MPWSEFFTGSLIAVVLGLDRTAAFQFMLSRPIVAGPLTGLVLGDAWSGLQIGALVELLWLGRLPVGAAIPPDDTQVTVAATVLSVAAVSQFDGFFIAWGFFCLLVAMPFGKLGQVFDRFVREHNTELLRRAEKGVAAGQTHAIEKWHLLGLVHFALASLLAYVGIVVPGWIVIHLIGLDLLGTVAQMKGWLLLAFPLVGTATILATINVSRAVTLFSASFITAFLLMWLILP
jgi:PTS system mannose-specific IIC component